MEASTGASRTPLSDTVIPMVHTLVASETAAAKAHAAYLQLNVSATQVQRAAVEMQMRLLAGMPDEVRSYLAQGLRAAGAGAPPPLPPLDAAPLTVRATAVPAVASPPSPPPPRAVHPDAVWEREDCVKIAVGKISEVFGPDFAEVDTYPTRVRLPDGPMNFVHRIMHISGDRGSRDRVKLGSGRIVTEHDVTAGEWYLDNGRIPTGVAVEAGQADLCLSGWLGIDFKTKGLAMYRLLDATVTIHDHLPRAGDVIRYDIRALRFIRQADTYLYFFEYDGTVDGRPFITMRDGCAGFFTPRQLDEGRGLVLTDEDLAHHPGKLPPDWRPLVPFESVESYDDGQLEALRGGDLASCFGEAFAGLPVRRPLTFPGGKLHLVDRVTEMDPTGGRFGLGSIRAEIDIAPDAWFLVCHFSDDNVMPGTLMYESCMQAWKVFLLRQGWVAEADDAVFEPVVDVRSRLRCRGQVVPGDLQAQYYIEIKEMGYGPEPYSVADAIMYVDGRAIVQCLDMSLRLSGVSRSDMERVWAGRGAVAPRSVAPTSHVPSRDSLVRRAVVARPEVSAPVLPTEGREPVPFVVPPADGATPSGKPFRGSPAIPAQGPAPAVYGPSQILAYARGYPSEGFGERYRVFDGDRYLARLPNPPYLLLDRITYVEGEPFVMDGTGTVIGQYDVPPDAWYFDANRQEYMPFSVILEIPLQVCGWYAAFCGSGLTGGPDAGLRFRNLDGNAVLHEPLGRDTGTLTSKIRFLSASSSGGMIIQKFDYQVFRRGRVVYEGDTVFGFFSAAALAQQVGIRGAKLYEPAADEVGRSLPFSLPSVPPLTPADDTTPTERGLVQPGKAYRMNDEVALLIPDGGPAGLGFIRGTKKVTRADWFFDAHFYGDPVIPGSLGLEAFLQLVKAAAINRWGAALSQTHHFEPMASGQRHSWTYRGQVVPTNREVVVDAWVTKWDDATHTVTASGFLKADGKPIYQMTDFALRAVPRG